VLRLNKLNLADNTILIFTGDNGTHPSIHTRTLDGVVQGGKGNTIDAGIHVPLIISWPRKTRKGRVYDDLIEFSDFFPSLADIVDKKVDSDGKSFYRLLTGKKPAPRTTAFVHYDPRWNENVNRYRNQFVMTTDYKLYQDGRFYRIADDRREKDPLDPDALDQKEMKIKSDLEAELKRHPLMK